MLAGLIAAILLGGFIMLIITLELAALTAALSKREHKEPGKILPFKDKERK